jgi:hypothetical protein
VPDYIESTYIDFSKVESPQILGNFIMGGEVYGGSFWNNEKTAYMQLGTSSVNLADFSLYRYNETSETTTTKIFSIIDNATSIELYGPSNSAILSNGGSVTYVNGVWNFSAATVTGLNIAFG